jgi:hypothetical protein
MLPDGIENLIERQVLLPLLAVASVVTRARPVQTQEPGQTIGTQFPLQKFQGVPFEPLVRQLADGNHSPCTVDQDSGFRTGIGGLPKFRTHRFKNRSSVVSRTSAPAASAAARCSASKGPYPKATKFWARTTTRSISTVATAKESVVWASVLRSKEGFRRTLSSRASLERRSTPSRRTPANICSTASASSRILACD